MENTKIKLVDYKGKYDIGVDYYDDFDIPCGEIEVDDFIKQLPDRIEACRYYGIPVYYGDNTRVLKAIKKLEKDD